MPKNSKDVVIVSALRTVIGKYNGIWAKIEAHNLGKSVIQNILSQTKTQEAIKNKKFKDEILDDKSNKNYLLKQKFIELSF